MSYLDLINDFWQKHAKYGFSTLEITLYFWFLNEFNRLFWAEILVVNSTTIINTFNIHRNTLHNSLCWLGECTALNFDRKNGSKYIEVYLKKPAQGQKKPAQSKEQVSKAAQKPAQQHTIIEVQVDAKPAQSKEQVLNHTLYNNKNKDIRYINNNIDNSNYIYRKPARARTAEREILKEIALKNINQ